MHCNNIKEKASNPFRMIFFAYPHTLSPMFSHSYKKVGGGWGQELTRWDRLPVCRPSMPSLTPTAELERRPTTSWREGPLPSTAHGKRVTRNGSRVAASGLRSVASVPSALKSPSSIGAIAEAKQRTRPREAFTFNFQLFIEAPDPVGIVDLLPPRPDRSRRARRPESSTSTHYSLRTTHCLPPTFLLRPAATVIRFPTGNSEESSEPSRSPRSSSVSLRLGGPPQHAHRPHRSLSRARPNQNRPILPGKNFHRQFQSSRLPVSVAP
jgi:hypothetical protein